MVHIHAFRRVVSTRILLASAMLLAAACGGGGPVRQLTVTITSPGDNSTTDGTSVSVSGTTTSGAGIRSVLVNGAAAVTLDGFATWTATVPINAGANTITATATDSATQTATASITVTGTALDVAASPSDLSFNADRQGALPTPQPVTVTFNGTPVTVSGAPAWLSVAYPSNGNASPMTFQLAPINTSFSAGTLTGDVTFTSSRGGQTRTATVHVTYTIHEPFDAVAASMAFTALKGSAQPPQPGSGYVVTIRGDGQIRWRITGPSWAKLNQTSGSGPGTVTVTADATGLSYGQVTSQVTVTDDQSGQSRNLPISLDLRAARLTVTPASLAFTVDASTTPAALSRSITVSDELGGTQSSESVAWTVQPGGAPWLTVTPASGGTAPSAQIAVSLDVATLATLPTGQQTTSITLGWQNGQLTGQTTTISVSLNLNLPNVDFASPYVGVENQPGSLIVRGRSFGSAGTVTALIGTTEVSGLVPDSDTQLRVSYPALPAGRYAVGIKNAVNIVRTTADLVVLPAPGFAYHAISAPSSRQRLVWDAERQALYGVSTADQQVERYRYSSGSWSTDSAFVQPQLTDVALSPNGRSLIVLTQQNVRDVPLSSSPWISTVRATNPDAFCGRYLAQLSMANDGNAFVVADFTSCSGYTGSMLYNVLSYSLGQNAYFSGWLYNGISAASADGSRIYAGSNGLSPAPEVVYFDALTDTVTTGPVDYNLYAVTVSGDASRVILQNHDVMSRSLTLTGNLGSTTGAVLASRDSSRAFVYRDDGGSPRVIVYDLNGALQPGAVYPVLKTVNLPDSPNTSAGNYWTISMAATHDDSVVFISGNSKILVVPVN